MKCFKEIQFSTDRVLKYIVKLVWQTVESTRVCVTKVLPLGNRKQFKVRKIHKKNGISKTRIKVEGEFWYYAMQPRLPAQPKQNTESTKMDTRPRPHFLPKDNSNEHLGRSR